jgi:hypothetical protein
MTHDAASDARVEHDRHRPALDFAGVETGRRALRRLAADLRRVRQIAGADHGAILIVALHRAVGPGDHRSADAVAGAGARTDETVGRDQRGARA